MTFYFVTFYKLSGFYVCLKYKTFYLRNYLVWFYLQFNIVLSNTIGLNFNFSNKLIIKLYINILSFSYILFYYLPKNLLHIQKFVLFRGRLSSNLSNSI